PSARGNVRRGRGAIRAAKAAMQAKQALQLRLRDGKPRTHAGELPPAGGALPQAYRYGIAGGEPARPRSCGWNLPRWLPRPSLRPGAATLSGPRRATLPALAAQRGVLLAPGPEFHSNSCLDASSSSPRLFPEILLELSTRTMQQYSDHCRRRIHHPGDLTIAVVFNETQHKHLRPSRIEPAQRP